MIKILIKKKLLLYIFNYELQESIEHPEISS